MPKRRYIHLSDEQRQELQQLVRSSPKPYLRERAAVLLRIEAGESAHAVAQQGAFLRREPDTVYRWLNRYEAEGVKGLDVRPGRGRKPAFSPSAA